MPVKLVIVQPVPNALCSGHLRIDQSSPPSCDVRSVCPEGFKMPFYSYEQRCSVAAQLAGGEAYRGASSMLPVVRLQMNAVCKTL